MPGRLPGRLQLGWDGIVLKAGIVYFIMNWHERIVADPGILAGKPVIRGTRMAVEFVLDLLANGWSEEEILKNYPRLTAEDILACFGWKISIVSRSHARLSCD